MKRVKEIQKFERFWANGYLKWSLDKSNSDNEMVKSQFDLFVDSLIGCNIQSRQSNGKLIVIKDGVVLFDFIINEITFIQNQGQTLIIKSEDKNPVFINFISEGECSKALQRSLLILNGFEVIDCNDEFLFICSTPKRLGLIFI